jgi:hypothetical protein
MLKKVFILIVCVFAFNLKASQASQTFSPGTNRLEAPAAPATSATYYQTYIWRDFQPFQSSVGVAFTGDGPNRRLYMTSGGGEVTARLQLPQGAHVTEATYFYFKNTATPMDLGLWISREDLATGQSAGFASIVPSITSTNMLSATLTLSPPLVIDNSQYAYEIYVGMYAGTPNLGFRGARIAYTVPTVWLPSIYRQ